MSSAPYIALTDHRWFEYLRSRSVEGRLDEANFWQPMAQRPQARLEPGDPFFGASDFRVGHELTAG